MEERRLEERIGLKIHARGILRTNAGDLRFTARVLDLSRGGARLELGEDPSNSVRRMASGGDDLKRAEVELCLISYVEDNIQAAGRVAYVEEKADRFGFGVEFIGMDDEETATLERVISLAPDVEKEKDAAALETSSRMRFSSLDDFVDNLTTFTILMGKEEPFFIDGEKFMFAGMHRTDSGEVHIDCIESVADPGKVICPDCLACIDTESLL